MARLNRKRPDLYLMPLTDGLPCAELYTLHKDRLHSVSTRGIHLAESFAPQVGWVVSDERIRWKDWLKQQGLSAPEKESGLKRLTGKARQIFRKVVKHKAPHPNPLPEGEGTDRTSIQDQH